MVNITSIRGQSRADQYDF